MKKSALKLILGLTAISFAASACSKKETAEAPIVQNSVVTPGEIKPSVAPGTSEVPSVQVTITLDKKSLEGEYFYGSDLQYSSAYDAGSELYNQSIALGHIPVRFRIAGQELQLIADTAHRYPSDVNHPEELISRYKILRDDGATITVSGADSSGLLGMYTKMLSGSMQASLQDSWIRSFQFDARGNYLLQQTSIMLNDGTVAEFMESVFPRARLKPSSTFAMLPMDPTHPIGADEGPAARYRFFAAEKLHNGEEVIGYADHFDIGDGATIDWYVTRNIPDEFLAPVGLAIEGWNRYFEKFQGIERKVVRFMGRLPEGVVLGDPRYNVVNWDSRLIAGAAYESQAYDPFTGKQSHSLIYLPAAWIMIGMEYWDRAQYSAPENQARPGVAGRFRISCSRDLRQAAQLIASGRIAARGMEDLVLFGTELLKGTLFHETGHALGLAHNFKGSLSMDRSKPGSVFSTSIMDYNDFELESRVFKSLDSSEGPLLEYDRQALSALYNSMKDVSEQDPVVPACNDFEADNETGGIDPLCTRYDIESDPTRSIETAWNRINEASLPGDVTLSQALLRIPALALDDEAVRGVGSREQLAAQVARLSSAMKGTLAFYYYAGTAALGITVRTNLKTLHLIADGVLPEGPESNYDARLMRERVFTGVQRTLSLRELAPGAKQALAESRQTAIEKLKLTPYVQSLPAEDAARLLSAISTKLEKSVAAFETDAATGLPRLRTAVYRSLLRNPELPYHFEKTEQATVDYETSIAGILAEAVPASGNRTAGERVAAAKSLATYQGRPTSSAAIAAVTAQLEVERATARDNASRELVEALLEAFKGIR